MFGCQAGDELNRYACYKNVWKFARESLRIEIPDTPQGRRSRFLMIHNFSEGELGTLEATRALILLTAVYKLYHCFNRGTNGDDFPSEAVTQRLLKQAAHEAVKGHTKAALALSTIWETGRGRKRGNYLDSGNMSVASRGRPGRNSVSAPAIGGGTGTRMDGSK